MGTATACIDVQLLMIRKCRKSGERADTAEQSTRFLQCDLLELVVIQQEGDRALDSGGVNSWLFLQSPLSAVNSVLTPHRSVTQECVGQPLRSSNILQFTRGAALFSYPIRFLAMRCRLPASHPFTQHRPTAAATMT